MCISFDKSWNLLSHVLQQEILICTLYVLVQDRAMCTVHFHALILHAHHMECPGTFLSCLTFDMFHTYPCPSIYQNSCSFPVPPNTPHLLHYFCTTQHITFTVSFLYHPTHCVYCIIPVPPNTLCLLYLSCTTQHTVFTVSFLYHPTHCVYCIFPVLPNTLCLLYLSCTIWDLILIYYIIPVLTITK